MIGIKNIDKPMSLWSLEQLLNKTFCFVEFLNKNDFTLCDLKDDWTHLGVFGKMLDKTDWIIDLHVTIQFRFEFIKGKIICFYGPLSENYNIKIIEEFINPFIKNSVIKTKTNILNFENVLNSI